MTFYNIKWIFFILLNIRTANNNNNNIYIIVLFLQTECMKVKPNSLNDILVFLYILYSFALRFLHFFFIFVVLSLFATFISMFFTISFIRIVFLFLTSLKFIHSILFRYSVFNSKNI